MKAQLLKVSGIDAQLKRSANAFLNALNAALGILNSILRATI